MFNAATPIDLLQSHSKLLLGHLPRVYDGDIEGVHDARVLTRRIRELLPLISEWRHPDAAGDLASQFKRIGRRLGRVRDRDVRAVLISYLESRMPHAAPALVVLRKQTEGARLRSMRKLIKRLDRLDFEQVLASLATERTVLIRRWTGKRAGWRERLRRALADRAETAGDAVRHATGVYFPNRCHRARIAIKTFRYAVEIAAQTNLALQHAEDAIRHLKTAQDALGDLHDRQVFVDDLRSAASEATPPIDPEDVRRIVQIVEAECHDLHAKYLARPSCVLDVCARTVRSVAGRPIPIGSIATVGAAAVASAAMVLQRRAAARRRLDQPEQTDISVRIPIAVG